VLKARIKAAIVAKKPDRLGHAAMGLTSLTALWAVEDTARQTGETILIRAAPAMSPALPSAREAPRRQGDHDRQRGKPRLRAQPRCRSVIDYNAGDFASGRDVVFDTRAAMFAPVPTQC
jgi:hypothetical protein